MSSPDTVKVFDVRSRNSREDRFEVISPYNSISRFMSQSFSLTSILYELLRTSEYLTPEIHSYVTISDI